MARLLVVGTGLIGGSFALAMRAAQRFDTIVGYDADAAALARAQSRGLIDEAATDAGQAAAGVDAVIVAVPTDRIAASVVAVAPAGVPVFDTGSVKGSVIDALRAAGRVPGNYVPTHPMAGSEFAGPDAARADLFRGRPVIITPLQETDPDAVASVASFWRAAGAEVTRTTPAVHDEMVALTSHLPHLVAYTFMEWAASPHSAAVALFAGPGVRDFTRIAGADAQMWRTILSANRDALLREYDGLMQRLGEVGQLLRDDRFDELQALLARGRQARQQLVGPDEP
jgi:prephenate dehydrogenase